MPIRDHYNEFQLVQDTQTIQLIPNTYGRTIQRGLFAVRGLPTTKVEVVYAQGQFKILHTVQRGGAPTSLGIDQRKVKYFQTYHFPTVNRVGGEDVQNVTDFFTGAQLDTVADAVVRKMTAHRLSHAITREFHQTNALGGKLVDSDGTTLIDLFSEFGITQKVIDFDYTDASLKVRVLCTDITRHMEDNAFGEVFDYAEVWCGRDFFDALISSPDVEKAYANWMMADQVLGGDLRTGFRFGGVLFSEYNAVADGNGSPRAFIAANEAIAFPVGTRDTFETYFAPPVLDGINQANTMGQEIYALQTIDPKGRFIEIDAESNLLAVCKRPGMLVKLTMTTS